LEGLARAGSYSVDRTVRTEIEKLADEEFAVEKLQLDAGADTAPAQRPGTLEENLEVEPSKPSKTNMRPLPSCSSTAETASKEAPQELPGTGSAPPPVQSGGFLHERMKPEDPNYELIKHLELNTWAEWGWQLDGNFSRHAPVGTYVGSAANMLERGFDVLILLNGQIPVSERCRALEKFNEAALQVVRETLGSHSKKLGEGVVNSAIREFSENAQTLFDAAKKKLVGAELGVTKVNADHVKHSVVFNADKRAVLSSSLNCPMVDTTPSQKEHDTAPSGSNVSKSAKIDKSNWALLQEADGKLKRFVSFDAASRFGGVTKRAIEKAARKGSLEKEGKRLNRRILVESLLKYFPPETNEN
jgi:hypothetical protein